MQQGYIKLHRQLINWRWYKNINVKTVFLHCLLRANHSDTYWQNENLKKGSFITSYENLAKETGLSTQQVRTAINKLKSTNELTYRTNRQYSIITVNNWDKFQDINKPINKRLTNEQQTINKRLTTDNNVKNDNNDNTHTIDVCVGELTDDEKKILRKYAQKSKAYNVDAYIHTLVKNGSYKEIVKNENERLKAKKVVPLPKVEQINENPAKTEEAYLQFQEKMRRFYGNKSR